MHYVIINNAEKKGLINIILYFCLSCLFNENNEQALFSFFSRYLLFF
jgi:hypothetical protein